MFLQFTVNNFLSIKEKATFSMLDSSKEDKNSFSIRDYNLLRTSVIYGANASGKTNILKAMSFMRTLVLNKYKIIQSTDILPYSPFRLNTSTKESSSSFEMVFFIDEKKYRYGFELDSTTIYSEWLFEDEKGKEAKLFYRDIDEEDYVNNQKFKEGYSFFDKSNKKINIAQNQLFLWVCDRLANSDISKSILKWFSNFNMLDGTDSNGYLNFTLRKMEDEEFKKEIVNLVKTADIGIENIDLQEDDIHFEDVSKVPLPDFIKEEILKNGGVKSISINTSHKVFDDKNNFITHETFELEKDESFGTKKFFKISAPVIDTLKNGKILLIDELDSSLHPILTKHLIKLFNDEKINKNNAQLIFTTHDTNLLKPTIFKREQIWFTQKDKYGSTNLYSMLEIKGVRASDDFEKHYIQGKYGAVPYIGEFEF